MGDIPSLGTAGHPRALAVRPSYHGNSEFGANCVTSLWGASAALARGVCLLGIIMPDPSELLTGDVLLFPQPGHGRGAGWRGGVSL